MGRAKVFVETGPRDSVLFYGLKQSAHVAEDRSVLIASLVLVYMVLFGHGLPTKINKNIL